MMGEQKNSEYRAFESLTKGLIRVPKDTLDKQVDRYNARKESRKKSRKKSH